MSRLPVKYIFFHALLTIAFTFIPLIWMVIGFFDNSSPDAAEPWFFNTSVVLSIYFIFAISPLLIGMGIPISLISQSEARKLRMNSLRFNINLTLVAYGVCAILWTLVLFLMIFYSH